MENENNVIAWVYVIQCTANKFVDPTIYLTQPEPMEDHKIHMFFNPFAAKKFIIENMGLGLEITVKKRAA